MRRRRRFIALGAAGAFCAGLGASVLPASAQQRTLVVTLLGGTSVTVTVDVPPGTPADQVTIPGVSTPVVSVREATPAATATPAPAPTAPPNQTAPRRSTPVAEKPPEAQPTRRRRRSSAGLGELLSIVPSRAPSPRPQPRPEDAPPSPADPTFSLAVPGAAPIGVPDFFIDKFRIRRSCFRSTRRPGRSTACAGRCWPRSTRSRRTTGAT
jgi:hypothetical protein